MKQAGCQIKNNSSCAQITYTYNCVAATSYGMKKINKQSGLALRNSKGFTLIEILVVIGIIAILATIVLIAINPARQFRQARDTQRVSNSNAILNAIGQYIADNKGNLPTDIDSDPGTKQLIGDSAAGDSDICDALVPKYIPAIPFDPSATTVDCTAVAYDTKYKVNKDANGRITVYASGEEPAGVDNISVTR